MRVTQQIVPTYYLLGVLYRYDCGSSTDNQRKRTTSITLHVQRDICCKPNFRLVTNFKKLFISGEEAKISAIQLSKFLN
jgi:hypothetical protein